MEINSSQVGKDFAVSRGSNGIEVSKAKASTEETSDAVQKQAKDLSTSAEKEIDKLDSANLITEDIEAAVSQLQEFVHANSRQLNFSVDEASNKQVVKVTDAESGKVIRQIPSEEVLKLSERLQDLHTEVGAAVGLLFNKQV